MNYGVVPYTRLQKKSREVSETNGKSSERRVEREQMSISENKKKMTKDQIPYITKRCCSNVEFEIPRS